MGRVHVQVATPHTSTTFVRPMTKMERNELWYDLRNLAGYLAFGCFKCSG